MKTTLPHMSFQVVQDPEIRRQLAGYHLPKRLRHQHDKSLRRAVDKAVQRLDSVVMARLFVTG